MLSQRCRSFGRGGASASNMSGAAICCKRLQAMLDARCRNLAIEQLSSCSLVQALFISLRFIHFISCRRLRVRQLRAGACVGRGGSGLRRHAYRLPNAHSAAVARRNSPAPARRWALAAAASRDRSLKASESPSQCWDWDVSCSRAAEKLHCKQLIVCPTPILQQWRGQIAWHLHARGNWRLCFSAPTKRNSLDAPMATRALQTAWRDLQGKEVASQINCISIMQGGLYTPGSHARLPAASAAQRPCTSSCTRAKRSGRRGARRRW